MTTPLNLADPAPDTRRAVLERLVAAAGLGDSALSRARQLAQATGLPPEHALNRLGIVNDDALAQAYVEVLGLDLWTPPPIDAETAPEPLELPAGQLSPDYLRRHGLLPLSLVEGVLEVAVHDPLGEEGLAGLAFAFSAQPRLLVARVSDLKEALDRRYPQQRAPAEPRAVAGAMRAEIERVEDESLSSDAVSIVTQTVSQAMRRRASDIHFEPRRHDLAVRLRVDGRLIDYRSLDREHGEPVVTRIKVLAGLDLGERRLPQDGRATLVHEGRNIELRVSIMPTVHGESAVLRILDRNEMATKLDSLGFRGDTLATLTAAARAPSGVFLVSGPTGSGKTTSLYAMLNLLKGSRQKILSVEDPVEYRFDHVIQVQAAPQIGLTFASALRSFLRQDPDVMLIGEIRDAETAEIAFQAAMTGHLVLASIHANDAVRVIGRLRDLQLPGYQIAAALLGASAQRLVRRLCLACREPGQASPAEQRWCERHGLAPAQVWQAKGCIACEQEGYVGRTVLSECFTITPELAEAIAADAPGDRLAVLAARAGMTPLKADAQALVEAGEITLADAMRVLGD